MRSALLTLLFASCALVQAQSWCAPGAHWKYDDLSVGYIGYTHVAYVGDTVHMGLLAQRFHTTGLRVEWPVGPTSDTTWIDYYHYTHVADSIVFVPAWVNGVVQWDTLLRFDAVPGDRWFLPNHSMYCSESSIVDMVEVIDTGHVDVDGVTLRFWNYGSIDWSGQAVWGGSRYYERIGYTKGFVPYPIYCTIIEVGSILKCYEDDDLSFIPPGWPIGTTCDITLGMPAASIDDGMMPFPNPGATHFTLSLPPGTHAITLIDATGREVLHLRTSEQSPVIGTTELAPGLYLVRVGDQAPLRWVKE